MASTQSASKTATNRRRPQNAQNTLSDEAELARDLVDYLKEYAREKPEVAALWCLGIGFILGWKLKPW
jgi:hypothetical protein